jgi:hypothetical protein
MNMISLEDALLLFDKWASEETAVVMFVSSPLCGVALRDVRIVSFSGDLVRFSSPAGGDIRLFPSQARFMYVEMRELPPAPLEQLGLREAPAFEECLRIDSPNTDTQTLIFSRLTLK